MRATLTYGQLPTVEAFHEAFDAECPDQIYEVRNCKRVGHAYFTAFALYSELRDCAEAVADGDDDAGDWASAVLSTLGFEWV